MTALTNSELQTRVRAGLGRGSSRTDQDENIVQSLNTCLSDVNKETQYPELNKTPVDITTVALQSYLTKSAIITAGSHQSWDLVDQISSMSIIDGGSSIPLIGKAPRDFEKSFPIDADTRRTGRPQWYTLIDQTIQFYPVPDDTYDIRVLYSLWPTPIQHSSGTITSGSSPGQASAEVSLRKSDSVLIAGALYWCYLILQNFEASNKFFGIYMTEYNKDKKKHGPKIDAYSGRAIGATTPKETSSPSAGALAGTSSWDAVYESMPFFG